MQVSVNASLTGAPDAGNMYVNLPSGYTIDTAKLADTTVGIGFLGSGSAHDSGTGSQTIEVRYKDTSSVYVTPRSGSSYVAQTVPFTWASGDDLNVYFEVPIAGWDANPKPLLAFPTITYGQDAEHAYGTLGALIGAFTINAHTVDTISNLGTLTQSGAWKFTATRRVKATVSLSVDTASANWTQGYITLNGTTLAMDNTDNTAATVCNLSTSIILEPSDYLELKYTAGYPHASNNRYTLLVEPIQGVVNQAAIISQPVAYVEEQQASTTNGGTSVTGVQNRTLNTLRGDIAAVGVSTNGTDNFTLPAGKYRIRAKAPARYPSAHQIFLENGTTGNYDIIGTSQYVAGSVDMVDQATLEGVITITSETSFKIKHYIANGVATSGLGVAVNQSTEVYTQVEITRMK